MQKLLWQTYYNKMHRVLHKEDKEQVTSINQLA